MVGEIPSAPEAEVEVASMGVAATLPQQQAPLEREGE
jgi:hypothetical protein